MDKDFQKFEKTAGYTFKDKALLRRLLLTARL